MRAKKQFGQNFLKDSSVVYKIIQSMPKNDHQVVEIGPGLGDLTSRLLEIKKVKAYEVDDDLSVFLKTHFFEQIQNKNLELIEQDVLKAWEKGSLHEREYDLVANLPYYIATAIILKALKDKMCKNMTLMIQKEVALKFAALPKQRDFCSLSVLARSISDVQILFDVLPSSFEPEPKVVSSVIRFRKFQEYKDRFGDSSIDDFEKFLKVAFAQPRKTLMKNLSQSYPKQSLLEVFEKFDLPLQIRAHEIDTKTYHRLFENTLKVKDDGKTNKQQNK